ncbi:MAG: GlsB/YeaQ/YmgE family stress response membrane protein [Thermodesulfobacteriota bacterium]
MAGIVWFLLIGLVAGWLAGTLVRGGGYGVTGDIVVGVIGAAIGGYVFGPAASLLGAVLVATAGAIILIVALRVIGKVMR